MPENSSDQAWLVIAKDLFDDYEVDFKSWYTTDQFLKKHPTGTKWTYWNALVYCGTVYSSIGNTNNIYLLLNMCHSNKNIRNSKIAQTPNICF